MLWAVSCIITFLSSPALSYLHTSQLFRFEDFVVFVLGVLQARTRARGSLKGYSKQWKHNLG